MILFTNCSLNKNIFNAYHKWIVESRKLEVIEKIKINLFKTQNISSWLFIVQRNCQKSKISWSPFSIHFNLWWVYFLCYCKGSGDWSQYVGTRIVFIAQFIVLLNRTVAGTVTQMVVQSMVVCITWNFHQMGKSQLLYNYVHCQYDRLYENAI